MEGGPTGGLAAEPQELCGPVRSGSTAPPQSPSVRAASGREASRTLHINDIIIIMGAGQLEWAHISCGLGRTGENFQMEESFAEPLTSER